MVSANNVEDRFPKREGLGTRGLIRRLYLREPAGTSLRETERERERGKYIEMF